MKKYDVRLPIVRKKRKINKKEFIARAKRVRKILKEEEEYLKEHEYKHPKRFTFDY
jgi:hypothetical protein